MIYNKFSRRMFLQGSGSLLAIPLMESLIPSRADAQATTPPVRYVQLMNKYGVPPGGMYGKINTALQANPALLQTVSPNVRQALLASLPAGDLAYILGPEISALRSKISILRGFDVLKTAADRGFGHTWTLPSCASGSDDLQEFAPPASGQQSIDCLLADSSKIYPITHPIGQRLVSLGPPGRDTYFNNESAGFSWKRTANGLQRVQVMNSTQPLYDLFSLQNGNQNSPITSKLGLVMSKVFDDYTKLKGNPRLSKNDRGRVQDYMDLLNDIRNGLANGGTGGTCTLPVVSADTDVELQFQNQTRILAAAMSCGSTRLASVALNYNMPTIPDAHGQHHLSVHEPTDARWANTLVYYENFKLFSRRAAYMINYFDGITETNGSTLLSNSIIYWAHEFGLSNGWGQHSREDFPMIVAGGGGGKLRQGHYIDYRKYRDVNEIDGHNGVSTLRGIPLNNLLVTFMNCMGLTYADYETTVGAGYGYYPAAMEGLTATLGSNAGGPAIPDEAYWFSTAGRRSPVPYLYTG